MILDDDEITIAKRLKRKEREEAPYRRNNRRNYGRPTTDLEPIEVLKRLLQDRSSQTLPGQTLSYGGLAVLYSC